MSTMNNSSEVKAASS